MSNTINVLNEMKQVIQAKFPTATIKSPTYFRNGDIDSTQHIYSLVTVLENGKVLEIKLYTNYIPFGGAEYKVEVTVTSNNKGKTFTQEIGRNQISKMGIIEVLAGFGMKFPNVETTVVTEEVEVIEETQEEVAEVLVSDSKEMTVETMLEYVTRYNGMKFENQPKIHSEHNELYNKVYNLIQKFDFEIVGLKGNTVTFRRKELEGYVTVRLGYSKIPGYVSSTETITGKLSIERNKPSVNPYTNEAWKIGDIDYSSPLKPMLTEKGWWSGD